MKSILGEMRLYNETDIMGILFYLISNNSRFRAEFFRLIKFSDDVIENSNINIYQEYSFSSCRADAYFELLPCKPTSLHTVQPLAIGVIEAKLHGAVSPEQLDGYRSEFKNYRGARHLVTLIPHVASNSQKQHLNSTNGINERLITWESIKGLLHDLLEIRSSEFSSVERTMAELLEEFIEKEIEAAAEFSSLHSALITGKITDNVNGPSYLRRCIQAIGSYFETMLPPGSRLEASDGKWLGRRLEDPEKNQSTYWIGAVNICACEPSLNTHFTSDALYLVLLSKSDQLTWDTERTSTKGYWKASPAPKLILWRRQWGGSSRALVLSAIAKKEIGDDLTVDLLDFLKGLMN